LKHLEEVERQTNKIPEELTEYRELNCPLEMVSFWNDFLEISRRRSSTDNGPSALTYQDMKYWSEINCVELTTFQQDVIFGLDDVWMKVQYDNIKKNMKQSSRK
jgi:hypothetical protein